MRFLFLAFLFTVPAYADSVNVQLFRSPFNLNYGMVESAIHDSMPWNEPNPAPRYFLAGDYHFVKDPLVVINTATNRRERVLVDSVHTLDLGVGYFLDSETSLYAQLPLNLSSMTNANTQADLGDSRIAAKFGIAQAYRPLTLAVMPELTMPTGNKARYLSDNGLGAGLLFIAENDFGGFRLSGNLGYRYSGKAQMPGIDYRNRIPIGLGAAVPLAKQWLLNLEANGALALPTGQRQNASEFYAGLNYHPRKNLAMILGGSLGAFDKAGASDYRIQLAVRTYLPEGKSRPAPVVQEEPEPVKPAPRPRARMVENRIEITEEIQFEHNSDQLKASAKKVLDEVAEIIRQNMESIKGVEVEGHTSLIGTAAYNMKLSWRRARAVVAYLAAEQKIPGKLLKPKGYGKSRPKYLPGKATPAELELNRRVEFQVLR